MPRLYHISRQSHIARARVHPGGGTALPRVLGLCVQTPYGIIGNDMAMECDKEGGEREGSRTGREIGGYRITRLLGSGGMSEVYEAEHVRLGSRHAVKFFAYEGSAEEVRDRFIAEGKLLAKLSHPRIVRVTDVGADPVAGSPYFVMDLVTGPDGDVRSFADIPTGSADEAQVAQWYDDLREGLAYIHSKGIVHRDLKLANILLGPDGHAVLTDFGISKMTDCETVADRVKTIIRLRDGKRPVMGSVGYMAPELEMGVAASPQSDYYALGVVVYRLLTGTWCDSRTDLASALDSYDPAWRGILPYLLHSHPEARKCVPWRDLKECETETQLMDAERNAEAAGRRALAAWIVAAALAAATAVLAVIAFSGGPRPAVSAPAFEDVVSVPPDAPESESDGRASKEQLEAALPDAWMLLHETLADLKAGRVSPEKALADIEKMAAAAENDDMELFDLYPHPFYTVNGESGAIAELLQTGARRLRERYGLK